MTRAVRMNLAAVAIAAALIAGLLALRGGLADRPLDRLRAEPAGERIRHHGSLFVARGGPVILGVEASGEAELVLDGAPLARGRGLVFERRVLAAGAHAIALTAAPGARLLWEPVGRRGPAEYVPASSLSPDPPDAARFDAPGTARLDGAIALAALAVILGLCAFLARDWLRAIDRPTVRWAAVVFAVAAVVRLADLGGAGQTWDEDTNWSAGRNYVTNLLSLDVALPSWRFNLEHPPVTKYLAGVGAQLADGYGPARVTSAVLVALACALLVPIGRRLHGLRAGAIAGVVAALAPHLIAHGKVVGHEAPTALWWALAVLLCLSAYDRVEPTAARLAPRFGAIGAVLGLAISTRFVNALLAPLIGALLVLHAPPVARRRVVGLGLLVIPTVALILSIAIWPRLWSAPVAHLTEAWQILKKPHGAEPFLGELTRQPGLGYFPLYLVATAPLGALLAALAGLSIDPARRRATATLLLWLAAPLAVSLSPVRQDGVRYIIPSLLALAALAGVGLDRALAALERMADRASSLGLGRRVALTALAAALAYLGASAARVHPYYLDYYGEHVGGPRAVAERKLLETAWWGEGLADALAYLAREAPPGARVHKACVEPSHLAWLRPDLWAGETRRASEADFILVYAPLTHRCPLPPDAELVHEVAVDGAPLARVYRRP